MEEEVADRVIAGKRSIPNIAAGHDRPATICSGRSGALTTTGIRNAVSEWASGMALSDVGSAKGKCRCTSPAQCTGVRIRVQAGAPRADRINTSYVERGNLTVRHFNKRFARLGLGYSRKLCNHRYAISLFAAAYNFCKVHSTLGCTPAVGLKLATETWTIERLIEEITK